MQLTKAGSYEEMCEKAAGRIIQVIRKKERPVLGLATGATPSGVYRKLVVDHEQNKTTYQHVTTFNLDEYVGLGPNDPTSFYSYMIEHFFRHIDIPAGQIHIPNGLATDLKEECLKYEQMIEESGGIDLQILGIGRNGHIGFNEPGTPLNSLTHVVELSESTRKANCIYFGAKDLVPKHALTMGLATIMKSREILLLVSGKHKAPILHQLLTAMEVTPSLPASILKNHPRVTVLYDEEALSGSGN